MILMFYNTVLALGIRECNDVTRAKHTMKEVPGPTPSAWRAVGA